ncbi:MAG: TIGR00300 family protein [Planctomycetota bacterium]
MARFEKKIHAEGHLIDSDLLSDVMDRVIREGSRFKIIDLQVGKTNEDPSTLEMLVESDTGEQLTALLQELSDFGFVPVEMEDARFEAAPAAGVVSEDFYSTTNHATEVFLGGEWHRVVQQRMDACIVRDDDTFRCVKLRDVEAGDLVLVGLSGVRVIPEYTPRDRSNFQFRGNEETSERQVRLSVERVAGMIRDVREAGGRVVWVPGPVVIHTGAAPDMTALIEAGFVDAVLSGNALAVHDVENAFFNTSLGVSTKDGQVAHLGHRHHMRAINVIRRAGNLPNAVAQGVLTEGICHALVKHNVPFCLAGSIRDDGPLPDTEMDLIKAQAGYAELLDGASLVIILSTMLHGIGVGNMLPGSVPLVCVDIHPAVVTKLCDRGSAQAHGIVTDVGLFLHLLRSALCDDSKS